VQDDTRRRNSMEDGGEVCFAEEVERLRRTGLSAEEISRRLDVDPAWVETVLVEDETGSER
jgi:hypothetical protein